MVAHYSLAGVATSAYMRLCACPPLMDLLLFDNLWASLMPAYIILDLLDISSTQMAQRGSPERTHEQ